VSEQTRRTVARIAAPLAFLLVVTIVVVVVRAGLDTSTSEPPPRPAAPSGPPTVVVRQGDTLEAIAAASGTTVAELRRLNPRLDPVRLQPGQKVRVR
jgi:LysM repeat protein